MKMLYGSWWLSLLIVAAFSGWSEAQYCNKLIPVLKYRDVWKNRMVPRQRQNWWGKYSLRWENERYKTTESYWDYEYRRVCCDGYERDSRENCMPVCQKNCTANSYCAAPNRCDCRDGYQLNDVDATCRPHCPGGCGKNSECTAPQNCACLAGYQQINDGNVCEPVCEESPCTANSYCAAPERCECELGYNMTTGINGTECKPVCSTPCSERSFCSLPDVCECENGYERDDDVYVADQSKCKPICEDGCAAHRKCIAPNHCACDDGYASSEDNKHEACTPICEPGCTEHSHCVDPDRCACDVGYSSRNDVGSQPQCQPHCSNDCPAYSMCVAPDVCDCLPGYTKQQTDDDGNANCVPVCENGCPNGNCHEPNLCVCDAGYLMGPNNVCEPACSLGCVNSRCTAPELCTCNDGYQFEANSMHKCAPICADPCVNGDCVAPDTCICWQDHEPHEEHLNTASSNNVCKPTCLEKCLNATCTSPHTCTCLPDYEPVSAVNTTACKPKCSGCSFGVCIAPNNCQCWPGFAHDGVQCYLASTSTAQPTTQNEEKSSSTAAMTTERDYPPLPAANCSALCDCWQNSDDLLPNEQLELPKCATICVDANDLPCLELNHCRCDDKSLELVCDDREKSATEDVKVHYNCRVKRLTTTNKPKLSTEERMQGVRDDSNDGSVWLVLAWIAAVGIVAAGCLFLSLRFVRRRHYAINQMEPEYENEAYEDDI